MSDTADTSTPLAARDHARSMAGTTVDTMPTLPPSAAVGLPDGVDAADVLWDEVVAGGGYTSLVLPTGSRLRIEDRDGDGCAGLLLHRADRPAERLNVADTVKVQWQARPTTGSVLLSDMGRVLAAILEDTSGAIDAFCGTSNLRLNKRRYGDGAIDGPSPNGRDLFALALAKHGLERRDVGPNVNLFKGVAIAGDGALSLEPTPMAGGVVLLRAELDLLVTIVDVPHPLDDRESHTVTPIRVTAWRGDPAPTDDPVRTGSPEVARAYLNTFADPGVAVGSPR